MARRALFFLLLRLVVCARTGRRASPHLGGELRRAEGRDRRRRRRRRRREGTTGHHGEHFTLVGNTTNVHGGRGGGKGEEKSGAKSPLDHVMLHAITGSLVSEMVSLGRIFLGARRDRRKLPKYAVTNPDIYQTTFRLSPRLQGCRPADYTTDYGYTSESNPIRSIHHPTRSVHTPTHGRALATRSTPHHC